MDVLEERIVNKYVALKILKERIKDKDVTQFHLSTYEILKEICELDEKKAEEIEKKLKELKLRERDIAMIIDFLPKTKEDLKILFEREFTKFDEETINKILEITNSV